MAFKNIQTSPIGISRQERTVNLYVLIVQSWDGCSTSLLVGIYRYIYIRKERSERRVFALFHFVCILFLYLYCVSIDFCATERILFCLNPPPPPKAISKIPIFQSSNFPKKPKKPKKTKKTIVPGLCLTPSSPHGLCRIGFFGFFGFFGKLEFWMFLFPGMF